jgi:hypothetical protein
MAVMMLDAKFHPEGHAGGPTGSSAHGALATFVSSS